ncbi:MAG: hypothetical protein ACXV3V_11580 [Actinomycetes bacterium]
MVVPSPRVPLEDAVHDTLRSTSTRLEALWEEAAALGRKSPEVSVERLRWAAAAQRIVDAMDEMERFARTMDPSLGRRDWRSRCNGGGQHASG